MANGDVSNSGSWTDGTVPSGMSCVTFDLEVTIDGSGVTHKCWACYPATGGPFTTVIHRHGGIGAGSGYEIADLNILAAIAANGGSNNMAVVTVEHPGLTDTPNLGNTAGVDDFGGPNNASINNALIVAIEEDVTLSTKMTSTNLIMSGRSRGFVDVMHALRDQWSKIQGVIVQSGLYDPRPIAWTAAQQTALTAASFGFTNGSSTPFENAHRVPMLKIDQLNRNFKWLILHGEDDETVDSQQPRDFIDNLVLEGTPATNIYFREYDQDGHALGNSAGRVADAYERFCSTVLTLAS